MTGPAPTPAFLAAYVRADPVRDAEFLAACLAEAAALLAQRIGKAPVPDTVRGLATREVAADLYHRRGTRNGIAGFDGPDLTPVRVTRDPLKAADDILRPYLGPGIA